jgi:hypothetical protein
MTKKLSAFLKHRPTLCVEAHMTAKTARGFFCLMMAGWLFGPARAADKVEPTATTRDALVYKDGDRVQGKLLERVDNMIVFKTDRFGIVRVPAADAVVIKAEKPAKLTVPPPAAAPTTVAPAVAAKGETPAAKPVDEREEEEKISIWERFSPWQLTAKVKNFFGPWHGKLAFSTELVSDTAERTNDSLEGHLGRKWERDEVQLNARYDYAETNNLATTDTLRGSGSWRHDFNKKQFAQYRPTVEWNRASKLNGVPNDYVLLQQEIGVGVSLVTRPRYKVRAGVSETLFSVWNSAPTAVRSSRAVESLFEETELTLPWRMTLSQRGVWYPITNNSDGWENRIDLSKKLTETLSVSVRHEIRQNNPDGTSQDYKRLKVLLGFDF